MADKFITQEQWDEIVSYAGDKIKAIKAWRKYTGDSLKEAKTAIEGFRGWGGGINHIPEEDDGRILTTQGVSYYVKNKSNKYTALQQAMLDLVKAQTALCESINSIINDTQEN